MLGYQTQITHFHPYRWIQRQKHEEECSFVFLFICVVKGDKNIVVCRWCVSLTINSHDYKNSFVRSITLNTEIYMWSKTLHFHKGMWHPLLILLSCITFILMIASCHSITYLCGPMQNNTCKMQCCFFIHQCELISAYPYGESVGIIFGHGSFLVSVSTCNVSLCLHHKRQSQQSSLYSQRVFHWCK